MNENKDYNLIIFAYPGVQMSSVLGLQDVFNIANRLSANIKGASLNLRIVDEVQLLESDQQVDVIILPPSLSGSRGANEPKIHNYLKKVHGTGAIMCSVCAGAFWLGNAGLLDNRPVTTHWLLDTEFRNAFPNSDLHSEELLIDDNDIVTAGGIMAWVDLALYVVQRWLGDSVMSDTARQLLVDPAGREQRNYRSFRPILSHGDAEILKLQQWVDVNHAQKITLSKLASLAIISERSLLRRFKAATGLTPNAYLQNIRIEKARRLLEQTRLPIAEICWKVGYTDNSAFSRLFKVTTGLSAGSYRKRFSVYRAAK